MNDTDREAAVKRAIEALESYTVRGAYPTENEALLIIDAFLAEAERRGYKLCPREVTKEMVIAGDDQLELHEDESKDTEGTYTFFCMSGATRDCWQAAWDAALGWEGK